MAPIRTAQLADAPAIARLTTQLGYPIQDDRTRGLLSFLLDDPEHDVLVFDDDGVLGWVGLFVSHSLTSEPAVKLIGLVVDERHRSQGIGKQLMSAAEDWARQRKVSKVRVQTNQLRAGAHRFYEGIGYSKVKDQRIYEKQL